MAALFAERIAQRTRDEWAQVFDSTDACVTPVLNWDEAVRHPHNVARKTFAEREGIVHPSPAPRMSGTPSSIGAHSAPSYIRRDLGSLVALKRVSGSPWQAPAGLRQ